MTAPGALSVTEAWTQVMTAVQGIGKHQRNTQGTGYNFRGIDAVVNAVGPALRANGVAVLPVAEALESERYEARGGSNMRGITLRVRFRIIGPAGDWMEGVAYGEAADAGDKAVSKAHSVAYRTFLLQALCIPTDEPDPDSQTYERGAPPTDAGPLSPAALRAQIVKVTGLPPEKIEADFGEWSSGDSIRTASAEILSTYLEHVRQVMA